MTAALLVALIGGAVWLTERRSPQPSALAVTVALGRQRSAKTVER